MTFFFTGLSFQYNFLYIFNKFSEKSNEYQGTRTVFNLHSCSKLIQLQKKKTTTTTISQENISKLRLDKIGLNKIKQYKIKKYLM